MAAAPTSGRDQRHEAKEDCREHGVFSEESAQRILVNVRAELYLETSENSPTEKRDHGNDAQPAPDNPRFEGQAILFERLMRHGGTPDWITRPDQRRRGVAPSDRWIPIASSPGPNKMASTTKAPMPRNMIKNAVATGGERYPTRR